MCFSARASFIAAATLTAIGVRTMQKASAYPVRLLAAVPLLFGVQQGVEGVVWLTIHSYPHSIVCIGATYGFMFFASICWPIYLPITTYLLEHNGYRKKLLFIMVLIGSFVACMSLLSLIMIPIHAVAIRNHIAYEMAQTGPVINTIYYLLLLLYLFATAGALMVSTVPYLWSLGILVLITFIIAHWIYYYASGSIWCFFAAVGSVLIYYSVCAYNKLYAKQI
jgi:hypothetical protein